MATGQTLLNLMELLDQELQLQPGESDVARGLVALNAAQDYFEANIAVRPKLLGGSTGTVATVLNTETSTFPTSLLRLDGLVLLNASSRPRHRLARNQQLPGSGDNDVYFPLIEGTGAPKAYYTDGTSIFWSPLPDGAHTVRWYGFASASDITASGTFAYRDIAMLPIAAFATKLMKAGVDDSPQTQAGLAEQAFKPVIDALALFNRDGALGLDYKSIHTE